MFRSSVPPCRSPNKSGRRTFYFLLPIIFPYTLVRDIPSPRFTLLCRCNPWFPSPCVSERIYRERETPALYPSPPPPLLSLYFPTKKQLTQTIKVRPVPRHHLKQSPELLKCILYSGIRCTLCSEIFIYCLSTLVRMPGTHLVPFFWPLRRVNPKQAAKLLRDQE